MSSSAKLADQVTALQRQLQFEVSGRLEAESNVRTLLTALAVQTPEDVLADQMVAMQLQNAMDYVFATDLQNQMFAHATTPMDHDEMLARSLEYDEAQAAAPGLAS